MHSLSQNKLSFKTEKELVIVPFFLLLDTFQNGISSNISHVQSNVNTVPVSQKSVIVVTVKCKEQTLGIRAKRVAHGYF